MQILMVTANNGVFVSFNGSPNYDKRFFINGVQVEPSFKSGWFKCQGIPERLSFYKQESCNKRFELIEKYHFMELPRVLSWEEAVVDDNGGKYYSDAPFNEKYQHLRDLYTYQHDLKDIEVHVEFELVHILHIDKNLGGTDFSYNVQKSQWKHEGIKKIDSSTIRSSFEAQLLYPPIVKEHLPCSLSAKVSYDIIRQHILENINPKVAKVTSDYDFCLTVKKLVKLHQEIAGKKEIKTATGRSYKNKRYREFFITHREVTVFKAAPAKYQEYPVVTPFTANSHEELKQKIDNYLEELMEIINAPLVDCPHCKGMGVIENN